VSQHFFYIPLQSSAAAEAELNQFIASHRVLSLQKHFVATELRTLCKQVAEQKAVPLYRVFDNEKTRNSAAVGKSRLEKYADTLVAALQTGQLEEIDNKCNA
jgi:hypothetical protein